MANRLRDFDGTLLDLCRASLLTPDEGPVSPACGQLIREVISQGRERFLQDHTRTPGPNEYRLNGDELKLQYEVECYRDGQETHVYVANLRLSGEQVEEYPQFVRAAKSILQAANGQGDASARRAA